MAEISFNQIPLDTRTVGAYAEIDNSRAQQGLVQNPHKALIVAHGIDSEGTIGENVKVAISRENLANGFFGTGSPAAVMCNAFIKANPYTELDCVRASAVTGIAASTALDFSTATLAWAQVYASGEGTMKYRINDMPVDIPLTSGMSGADIGSALYTKLNGATYSHLGLRISHNVSAIGAGFSIACSFIVVATYSGLAGNGIDIRLNYYEGESLPGAFSASAGSVITASMLGGTGIPVLSNVWAVIENDNYEYIITPYDDATTLTAVETEAARREGAMIDQLPNCFVGSRNTSAALTTLGNSRNSAFNTIIGAYESPTHPMVWGAVWGAIAARYLQNDPARPLQMLKLPNVNPPPATHQFTREERNVLLYDGIATWIETGGSVFMERSVTTYQTNALGLPDESYLDVETLATLREIRFQWVARMANRFLIPRFKLADDGHDTQAGSYVATPSLVYEETMSLATLLLDKGLIENLEEFKAALIVQRNSTNPNRTDTLLPFDTMNQFRMIAGALQFRK